MDGDHMGKLLEVTIRRRGLTITEVSNTLNVSRRTLYNWLSQNIFSKAILTKLSESGLFSPFPEFVKPETNTPIEMNSSIDEEAYWKEKYLKLLNQYTELLTKSSEKNIS